MITRSISAWQELTALRNTVAAGPGPIALELLQELARGKPDGERAAQLHRDRAVLLVGWAADHPEAGAGDAWRLWLVEQLLTGDNLLGQQAAVAPVSNIGSSLLAMARADLGRLRYLYGLSSSNLCAAVQALGTESCPTWDNGLNQAVAPPDDRLRKAFHSGEEWGPLLEDLSAYYFHHGTGSLGRYQALRWDAEAGMVGVESPDPISLDDLVGYDYQRQMLIANTEQFLAGYPCNNILLYGARGTGKSSLVKAMLTEYSGRGLRLVEVAREDMGDFPTIVRQLRGRPQRFLLFADDLSYDDAELHYRELKAALEGSIEGRPENVLLYATSNRRHLIKERFRDRDSSDDEIHTHDTAQEKLSLSDRFGLTLSFPPPSQSEYLRMVEVIAQRRGLTVLQDELHGAALRWTALHNTPSGRTARQFVDDLEGRIKRAGKSR